MKFLLNYAFLDAATPWQLGFQDPATPIIISIIHFHNPLIFFLILTGIVVFWLLYHTWILFKKDTLKEESKHTHSTLAVLLLFVKEKSVTVHKTFPKFIVRLYSSLKHDAIYIKSNKHFRNYIWCFTLVFVFSILWGVLSHENLLVFIGGLAFSALTFKRVIGITYPKSLKPNIAASESFFEKMLNNKKTIITTLISLLFFYAFYYYLFPLCEWYAIVVIDHTRIFFIFIGSALLLLVVGGFYYLPKVWVRFKARLNASISTSIYNRANKKTYLFFLLYPQAKTQFFVCFLGLLSFICNTPFLFYPFLIGSIRCDNGLLAYFFYLICIFCALIVTLPSFRNSFFCNYKKKNSFRILGWNHPEVNNIRTATTIFILGLAYTLKNATADGVEGAVQRENKARDDALEDRRRAKHIKDVDVMREKDPEGYDRGRYKYPPLIFKESEFGKSKWPTQILPSQSELDSAEELAQLKKDLQKMKEDIAKSKKATEESD